MIKHYLKACVNLSCLVAVYPLYLMHIISSSFSNLDRSFWGFSQFFSLLPGTVGIYLRKNFYRLTMEHCEKDCAILFGTIFSQTDTEIGKGVYIGPNCNIGTSKIDDYCTIGSNVHIMSGKRQHHFDDINKPIQQQDGVFDKVVIGEDTWIGNCALIMASIGKKCIIGAGAVVLKDVEDYSIVVGNPAEVIRKRK